MAVTVTNLLAGPAQVLVAPFGTAEPANAEATPGVGWVDVGGTDGGVRLVMSQTFTPLTVDQIAGPVGTRLTDRSVSVATSMAEATLANLRLALNLPVDAGTTVEVEHEISNADPPYKAVMIVGQKPGGGPRLIIVRRALPTESVEMAWTKDGKTMIPITFTGYYVSASVSSLKIDDTEGA
jgi:hypothetical protein